MKPQSDRTRIARTISLMPHQEAKLASAVRVRPELEHNISRLFQELIDHCIDEHTGRARSYLDARDRAIDFHEDVKAKLQELHFTFTENHRPEKGHHRVDFFISCKRAGGRVALELKSSGRYDRLELALGSALILKQQLNVPVIVVVPYLMAPGLTQVYASTGVGLCTIDDLEPAILAACKSG